MQIGSKTVVVTGAGRGIGRAIALRFAAAQANLALLDLNATDLDETRVSCLERGVNARTYQMSVASEPDVVATMESVAQRLRPARCTRQQCGHHPRRPSRQDEGRCGHGHAEP